ncbi:Sialic acid-binding Ig-like lectin 15 [Dissostichus eleginoides]|uniref:Sialic acid-binding Ig-like lectin 15 n=1 Tax=Dissostichus eleginoides TaxID=100907 RepID=A0AAD9FBZ7_DISEL|nr:Sialic acid-binding Ig-like lectin 15 [Dissostichus eleginoides]
MEVRRVCSILSMLSVIGALGAGDDGWSMTVLPEVRALEGYPVVLPCTFSHPQHSQHTSLQLLWRLGHGQGASVLFRCTSRTGAPSCEPGPQQDQRYRLEGNPREHDLSLRINSAALQDSGRYYCRVEVQGRDHVSFEDKIGTRLRLYRFPAAGRPVAGYRGVHPGGVHAGGGHAGGVPPPGSRLQGVFPHGEPAEGRVSGAAVHLQRLKSTGQGPGRPVRAAPRPHVGGAFTPLLLLLSLPLGAKVLLLLLLGGVWAVHGVRCWRK